MSHINTPHSNQSETYSASGIIIRNLTKHYQQNNVTVPALNDVSLTVPEAALSSFRLQCFGFVFQDHQLLAELTNEEKVALPLMLWGDSPI